MAATQSNDLRLYELMVILSGNLTESDFEKELGGIKKMLKEYAKAVTYEDIWGRRDFTYRLKRQNHGYYAIFDFNATPESLAELRMSVKLHPHVLRHLLISLPENYEPGKYKTVSLPVEKPAEEKKKHVKRVVPVELERTAAPAAPAAAPEEAKKTVVAGKEEEEKLKKVEKKLEEILENPDIEIR